MGGGGVTGREYVELREGRGASVRRVSDGWLVTCPAHDDRNPSLHVSEDAEGNIGLHCHAGCETADVKDADGLDWGDLFADGGRRNGRVEVEAYRYADERGRVLFEVVRFEPKDFRQRRPDGRYGIAGVRRVLYRLPQVLAAVQAGTTVYVVEGEKDVHALERAGLVATCNPMGAGKWRAEYAESLRGARVVVIADRDEPGREHAHAVARSLRGVAASVEVVEAAVGKDASDHLAAGKTVGGFIAAKSGIDYTTLRDDAPRQTRVGDVDGATFALDAPSTIAALWGERSYVLWPEGEPTMLYGPDGVGKTTIAQQLALRRIGVGEPKLLGRPVAPVADGKRVLYLALDRPRQAARSIRRMVAEEHRATLRDRLLVWRGSVPFDIVRDPESLAAFASDRNADSLVIDSVKDLAGNLSDEEVGMAIHRAWQLCVEAGIDVLGLHHPRKAQPGNKRPTALADVYGSRWITAGCGSIILVWGEAGDPVVDLVHLKQPADVVGPLTLLHDNRAGAVTVADEPPDPVDLVLGWVGPGPTVREVAAKVYGKSVDSVKRNEKERVRRRLAIGVADDRLRTLEVESEGGETLVYMAANGGAR
jgi:replicative DNA helicase